MMLVDMANDCSTYVVRSGGMLLNLEFAVDTHLPVQTHAHWAIDKELPVTAVTAGRSSYFVLHGLLHGTQRSCRICSVEVVLKPRGTAMMLACLTHFTLRARSVRQTRHDLSLVHQSDEIRSR